MHRNGGTQFMDTIAINVVFKPEHIPTTDKLPKTFSELFQMYSERRCTIYLVDGHHRSVKAPCSSALEDGWYAFARSF